MLFKNVYQWAMPLYNWLKWLHKQPQLIGMNANRLQVGMMAVRWPEAEHSLELGTNQSEAATFLLY